jgi:Flp pilus assembly protein TadG
MKWMHFRTRAVGASLVEFALVLPLLLFLVIGGTCLFVRNLYRDSLDEAAEQAAWAAARTGGDLVAMQDAVQRALPFVPPEELLVRATSTGYHAEVIVTVNYVGTAIATLPFFNAPLSEAQASATNQQERPFALELGAEARLAMPLVNVQTAAPPPITVLPAMHGPAAWPSGPAALPGGH